jgi:hypothetical protein
VQALPLQPTPDAFVALHLLPQPPQLEVVVRVVHVEPQRVSRHVHEPLWQSGLGCWHVASFVHVPAEHICGVSALHCVSLGEHTPVHTPPTHVLFAAEQSVALPHVPVAVHE